MISKTVNLGNFWNFFFNPNGRLIDSRKLLTVEVSTAQGSERSKLRKLRTPKILTHIEISYSFGE